MREYAPRIGLAESFTIHDRGDSEDLAALVRHELGLDTTRARFPGKSTCIAIYSRAINAQAPLADVLGTAFAWCVPWEAELRRLFDAYVSAKQAQNVLDYDDLLLYWSQMVGEASIAREIGARFDHVLVDEYQDTNALQASILRALWPDGRGVAAVGDDAQSIYAFRAATVRNILDFPSHFGTPARVLTLERNYRSTQPILDAANAVIALARERYTKNLWTDRAAGARPSLVSVRDAERPGALRRRAGARDGGAGRFAQVAGGALSQRIAQRAARDRAGFAGAYRSSSTAACASSKRRT